MVLAQHHIIELQRGTALEIHGQVEHRGSITGSTLPSRIFATGSSCSGGLATGEDHLFPLHLHSQITGDDADRQTGSSSFKTLPCA